jgi:hypothetical protein
MKVVVFDATGLQLLHKKIRKNVSRRTEKASRLIFPV